MLNKFKSVQKLGEYIDKSSYGNPITFYHVLAITEENDLIKFTIKEFPNSPDDYYIKNWNRIQLIEET